MFIVFESYSVIEVSCIDSLFKFALFFIKAVHVSSAYPYYVTLFSKYCAVSAHDNYACCKVLLCKTLATYMYVWTNSGAFSMCHFVHYFAIINNFEWNLQRNIESICYQELVASNTGH